MTVKRMTRAELLDAFGALGAFNPVGHVVLAFADAAAAADAAQALRADDAAAARVREVAERHDARAGVRYHRLASEEIIEPAGKRGQP